MFFVLTHLSHGDKNNEGSFILIQNRRIAMKKCLLAITLAFFLSLFLGVTGFAQTEPIVGKWKTIDDETNQPKSIIEIYEQEGKYFGKIVKLFRQAGEDPDPICDKCDTDDPRKDQPVKGMVILTNLEKDDDEYEDGEILDPKNGKVYDCDMEIVDGKLEVRGYIGISLLGRTQIWLPAE